MTVELTGYPQAIAQHGDVTLASVTGLTGKMSGAGYFRTVELTLEDVAVALADNAGVVAYGGKKLFDFPEGAFAYVGAVADLALTKSSAGVNADWDGDISLGTVTASNNASLSSTEQDLAPTTPTPQAVSGTTTGDMVSTAAPALFDGSAGAKSCYLNLLVDDADHDVTGTACNLIVNGTIKLHYIFLGDK